ncbi:LysR family transcriptional regulator [Corynebacterium crudilactis]|uniref:LysR family transcriptional regulator n=1 Tax=Corynebacterium crudilactis TaxID=1652495 RepID=UPI00093A9546|nr:LysR family transcriptional regulator [Corynebacterium crudilactis]
MFNISLRQLEYLVTVAETGTINAAADICMVSPVAVGHALGELDRALGTPLTNRVRAKGVSLTPAGETVAEQARKILQDVAQLPLLIDAQSTTIGRTVRIGAFASLSASTIPPLITHFRKSHPETEIHFIEGDYDVLTAALSAGEIDMFLAQRNQLRPGVQALPIRRLKPYILMSTDHLLAAETDISFHQLHNEDFIRLGLSPARQHMTAILEEHGLKDRIRWTSDSIETVKELVGSGLGISLLYSYNQHFHTISGKKLSSVPIRDIGRENFTVVCIPDNIDPSPATLAVVDFFRSEAEQILPVGGLIHEQVSDHNVIRLAP